MVVYEKFFYISNDLLCVLDKNGYYKKVNPALLNLLGYTEEEFKLHPFPYYLHPDDLATTLEEYKEVTKGIRNKVINNRFRGSDGNYYWISWSTIVQDKSGVFYSSGQNITDQKMLENALQRERQESEKKVLAAVTKTQEWEREQFSHELHDNINQILTTVKLLMELSLDEKSDYKSLLNRSIQLQQTAINEIRNLSRRLSAPSLGKLSLSDSIRDLIQPIEETKQLRIIVDDRVKGKMTLLEQTTHLTVYRILQEHLTNILKHANATEVNIRLENSGNNLQVQVTDNGKGFDPEQKSKGIGLQNMKVRAASVQGKLIMESAPGKGTKLLFTLQIPSKVEA